MLANMGVTAIVSREGTIENPIKYTHGYVIKRGKRVKVHSMIAPKASPILFQNRIRSLHYFVNFRG